ncbi:MAG: hypothetical protein U0Y82_00570 [Thermoleophilia bacterium]
MAAVGLLALVAAALVLGFFWLPWLVVLGICLIGGAYFLLISPADCRATNRTGQACRNNARGLLGACHLQQHKRQKLRALLFSWKPAPGRRFTAWWQANTVGLFGSPRQCIDTLGSVGSALGVLVAVVALLIR